MENWSSSAAKCVLLSLTLVLTLTACAIKERATGVKNTFLEDVDISSKLPNLPFEHAWVAPDFNKTTFTAVYFMPVRVDLLPKEEWARSSSPMIASEEEYFRKAKEVAAYFKEELIKKTRDFGKKKLEVAEAPGPNTLVVEIVLTELEFSHPIARAGSLLAPVPGTGAAIASISDPHLAFAARITDGASGQLVATAADRKFGPTRIIDFNKLTVSSSAREVCSLWADTITAALQGDGTTKIKEKKFDWMPW